MNKTIITLSILAVLSLGIFSTAYAASYNLLQPIQDLKQVNGLSDYINKLVPFILMLAAVLAVVQIVIGGMEWALSESITGKSEGKDRITMALLGLLIALLSYIILNTINPDLVNLKDPSVSQLNSGGSNQTSGTPIVANLPPGAPCGNDPTKQCASGRCDVPAGGGGKVCLSSTESGRSRGASCGQNYQCSSGKCSFYDGGFKCE